MGVGDGADRNLLYSDETRCLLLWDQTSNKIQKDKKMVVGGKTSRKEGSIKTFAQDNPGSRVPLS